MLIDVDDKRLKRQVRLSVVDLVVYEQYEYSHTTLLQVTASEKTGMILVTGF